MNRENIRTKRENINSQNKQTLDHFGSSRIVSSASFRALSTYPSFWFANALLKMRHDQQFYTYLIKNDTLNKRNLGTKRIRRATRNIQVPIRQKFGDFSSWDGLQFDQVTRLNRELEERERAPPALCSAR